MDEAKMADLLGRPLTERETTNFDLYLENATQILESILNRRIELSDAATERKFVSREGYNSLPVDIFTGNATVTFDESEVDAFVPRQGGSYEGSWFDTIEFDDKMCEGRYTIEASWGFEGGEDGEYPAGIQVLLAGAFAIASQKIGTTPKIKSESSLSHSVTYGDGGAIDNFIAENVALINQWKRFDDGFLLAPNPRRTRL